MGHGAEGPGETSVYYRELFGLFHGAGMERNVWEWDKEERATG